MRIPIYRPPKLNLISLTDYLSLSVKAGQYSNNGPLVELLSNRLGQYLGMPRECLVLASSATLALEAAVATAPSSESLGSPTWGVPAWSFVATGLAALRAGVSLEFLDVCQKSGIAVDNPSGSRGLSMGVAPFGASPAEGELQRFTLVDAAASFDSLSGLGAQVKSHQGFVVSLHATKLVSAGEGGFFFSRDLGWVERVRSYLSFGFKAGTRESHSLGTNGKLSEVAAAAALASLDDWPANREKLLQLNERARIETENSGFTFVGGGASGFATPYWIVKCRSEQIRESLRSRLESEGVETRLWWVEECTKCLLLAKLPLEVL